VDTLTNLAIFINTVTFDTLTWNTLVSPPERTSPWVSQPMGALDSRELWSVNFGTPANPGLSQKCGSLFRFYASLRTVSLACAAIMNTNIGAHTLPDKIIFNVSARKRNILLPR